MSYNDELNKTNLKLKRSTNESSGTLKTSEYFNEKYNNFIAFIAKLSVKYPELCRLSTYLNVLPLQEFREMITPKLMDALMYDDDNDTDKRDAECARVIKEVALENGFDLSKLGPDDESKIIRYTILFCVLLGD